MSKRGKNYQDAQKQINRDQIYSYKEAIELAKQLSKAKFDETVEVAVRLGVDPKHADQQVRGTVVLPHGTGKVARVLVFAKGEKLNEAEVAGADFVGAEDLVAKIEGGWLDFDVAIATPDLMSIVGKLGRILGPRGLMPNPKTGTVTFDLEKTIKEFKAGKIEYRVDKAGNVHAPLGKVSFEPEHLAENFFTLFETLVKARPAATKGRYIKGITISTTMGPGIKIDPSGIIG